MRRPQDATLVLEACFSAHVDGALLYPENLTARFFDLSSGEAGVVLDKLRRFGIHLAIVCAPGSVEFSSRFREILSDDLRVFVTIPWWIERALMFLAVLWFVNLVNFMDGIDWMTVAEVIPLTAGLSLFGLMGALTWDATLVAFALCGAMAGFAPFNRPVARLFLGDVGSLPIGLLLAWLLVLLAGSHLAAALLLPLYYVADATITLLRRLIHGEPVMQAHRSHFYQRALDRGFSVYQIVGRVFAINVALVGLAAITFLSESKMVHAFTILAGSALVGFLLWNFGHAHPKPSR